MKLKITLNDLRKKGIKTELNEVIPPKVPENQNAAVVYNEIFKRIKNLEEKYKKEIDYIQFGYQEKLKPEEKKIMKKIIEEDEFKEIFQLTEKAVNMPYCRFDIKYEDGPRMILSHLAELRKLSRYICTKIYFSIEDKKYEDVKKYAKIGLKLGDCLKNEPILISQLVRIAIDEMIMKSMVKILNNSDIKFSEYEYKEILSLLNNKKVDLSDTLNGEMVILGKHIYENYIYSLKMLESRRMEIYLYSPGIYGYRNIFAKLTEFFLTPIFKNDYCFYLKNFVNIIETNKKPYYITKDEKFVYDKKEFYGNKMNTKYFWSLILLPPYSYLNVSLPKYIAHLDTFKIAIALKIYKTKCGEYPESIEKIVPEILPYLPIDPFTGENYIYKRKGNGFLIYSLGENQKDDNGIYDTKKQLDDIGFEIIS